MARDTEKRITAKFVLDSTGFNSSLKGVNSELRNTQSQLKLASAGIQTYGRDSERLQSVQESLTRQAELHSKKVDIYKDSIEKTTLKMSDNIKERDKLGASLEKANKKYDEAVRLYGEESEEAKKAKEEVNRLSEEHKKAEKAVESNAKQIQNYETNMNKANTQLVKTQGELKKVNEELDHSNNKWLQSSKVLQKQSDQLKSIGEKTTEVGKSLTTKVTVPLMAVGGIAIKTTADYSDSMSQLQAITNSSTDEMDKMNKAAKDMGIQTRYSAKESADSMIGLGQAGYNTNQILNTTPAVLNLAQAGAIDLTQSTDVLVSSMSQFGIATEKAGHVADVLSLGANKANLGVGELAESMKYAGAMANTAGWSLEDMTAAIGLMSNYGIKGSQAGTALRGSISRLVKPSKSAAEAMGNLGIKVFDSMGKMKPLPDILDEINKKTSKLTEQQKLNTLVTIFGQEAVAGMNALLTEGGDSLRTYSSELQNADGSAKKAADTMEDNLGGSMRSFKSAMEGAMIAIGTALTPTVRELTNHVTELTRKFANLSPQTQQTVAKFGALALAAGPVTLGLGKIFKGTSTVVGGLAKLTKKLGEVTVATKAMGTVSAVAGGTSGIGALATGILGVAKVALPVVGIIAGVGAAAYGLHKVLSTETVPSVDLFADKVEYSTKVTSNAGTAYGNYGQSVEKTTTKISESTKKAVGAYMEMDKGVTSTLNNLYYNSTAITEQNKQELIGKYNEMGTTITTGLKQKRDEDINNLSTFFAKSSAITDAEEKQILAKTDKQYQNKTKLVDYYQKQIQEILEKAKNEHRALTEAEAKEINDIQNKMKTQAVKTLSDSEVESKVIMERLKGYTERITAEQASEVIKNAEKQRKQSVSAAEKQYNETVATIIKMRDESKTITADQADKLIADAERQRKGSVDKADEMKQGVIKQIKQMNSETLEDIDTTDGHILTRWDKMKDWFKNNPITRFIKTITSGDEGAGVKEHWAGTIHYEGGLTTLHERGYEVYNLPKGTRIYNHDASEDLVMKTAESVATKIAGSMLNQSSSNGKIEVTQHIYAPVPTPSELARQSKNSLRELALQL